MSTRPGADAGADAGRTWPMHTTTVYPPGPTARHLGWTSSFTTPCPLWEGKTRYQGLGAGVTHADRRPAATRTAQEGRPPQGRPLNIGGGVVKTAQSLGGRAQATRGRGREQREDIPLRHPW